MKLPFFLTSLFFSLGTYAQILTPTPNKMPIVQLSHRIEIENKNGSVNLTSCDFNTCSAIGKGTYSAEQIKAAAAKINPKLIIAQAVLKSAETAKGACTYALLAEPYETGGKRMMSALGNGGSAFEFVSPMTKKTSKLENDFIFHIPSEMIGNFQFFDIRVPTNRVKSDLANALK